MYKRGVVSLLFNFGVVYSIFRVLMVKQCFVHTAYPATNIDEYTKELSRYIHLIILARQRPIIKVTVNDPRSIYLKDLGI
jgi:hypothetical protein